MPGTRPVGETCYKCVVTADGAIPVSSRTVVVTVSSLSITAQPLAETYVLVGSVNASLSITATTSDNTAITYQWHMNTTASNTGGMAVNGGSAATLALPSDLTSGTHYFYCVATNAAGASEVSDVATVYAADSLTVVFTEQPQPVSVIVGSISGTLSCAAMATDALLSST